MHAGPFHVQDWEGNASFSLKVCVHSGMPVMSIRWVETFTPGISIGGKFSRPVRVAASPPPENTEMGFVCTSVAMMVVNC